MARVKIGGYAWTVLVIVESLIKQKKFNCYSSYNNSNIASINRQRADNNHKFLSKRKLKNELE